MFILLPGRRVSDMHSRQKVISYQIRLLFCFDYWIIIVCSCSGILWVNLPSLNEAEYLTTTITFSVRTCALDNLECNLVGGWGCLQCLGRTPNHRAAVRYRAESMKGLPC